MGRREMDGGDTKTERRDGMGKKERRRGEWNRAGRNEWGAGGQAERWSYRRDGRGET